MTYLMELFENITKDDRYLRNLYWGKPRPGHPEGTVRVHIEELEQNLGLLCSDSNSEEYWKLKALIHVHDSFKAEATPKVAITDPKSHASIARAFLNNYCKDHDLLNMVQYHDEPYALWRQSCGKGKINESRLARLIGNISDWRLFLRFNVIDGVTDGKSIEPLEWANSNIASAVGFETEARRDLEILINGRGIKR